MKAHDVTGPLHLLKAPTEAVLLQLQSDTAHFLETPEPENRARIIAHLEQLYGVFIMLEENAAAMIAQDIKTAFNGLPTAPAPPADATAASTALAESVLHLALYFEWLQIKHDKPLFTLQPQISAPVFITGPTLQQIAKLLLEDIVFLKDTLDRLERDSNRRDNLQNALPRFTKLADTLTLLNLEIPASLLRQQQQHLQAQLQNNASISAEHILPAAYGLTLVHDSVQGIDEFVYSHALDKAVAEQLDEAAQYRLLLTFEQQRARRALYNEACKSLAQARAFINTHSYIDAASSDSNTVDWSELDALLEPVNAALLMLDAQTAQALSQALQNLVQALRDGKILRNKTVFLHGFADIVIALEQGLLHDAGLPPADSDCAVIDQAAQQLQTIAALIKDPEDEDIEENETSADNFATSAANNASELTHPAVPDEPESSQPNPVKSAENAMTYKLEPDFADVFFEEIQSEAETLSEQLALWRDNPAAMEPVLTMRRSFHTLKGSSRIVGLPALGDFAWDYERLLNNVVEGRQIASAAIINSVAQVQSLLQQLSSLDDLNQKHALLAPLAEQAQALLRDVRETADAPVDVDIAADTAVTADTETDAIPPADIDSPSRAIPEPAKTVPAPAAFFDGMDKELLQTFISEVSDILDASDFTLQRWRIAADDQGLLNDLRRDMHTLKGSSRLTGLFAVGDLAHATESIFDALHQGLTLPFDRVIATVQRALDTLSNMLARVKEGVAPESANDLINEIHSLLANEAETEPEFQQALDSAGQFDASDQPTALARAAAADSIRVSAGLLNRLVNHAGESSIFRARIGQGIGTLRYGLNELDQTADRLRAQLRRLDIETEAQILFRRQDKQDSQEFDPLELDRFSELQQLSRSLLEIVDDLYSVRNSLEDQTQAIGFLLDQQAQVNQEIQQGLMQTRLVSFASVLPRLQRVVRQAARELGKNATLRIRGSEADVDRTVLDNMIAPLEHMLRNAVAHGIEPPDVRRASGKPELGTIVLDLHREGAELVLSLQDDGAGIDFSAIRARGEAEGLLASKPADKGRENTQELLNLLLRPGFSTAKEVTPIAGRGVGLDVLHEAIKGMRGALQIHSETGKGTVFTIRLPFSLALTQALLVQVGGDTFAVPLLSIEAVARLDDRTWNQFLEGKQVSHRYGDHDFPLYSMGLFFDEGIFSIGNAVGRRSALLFRSAEASAALHVDAILGSQEIIVKPLGPQLLGIPGISGATVLSDGRVVIVLELASLVRRLGSQTRQGTDIFSKDQVKELRQAAHSQQRINAMVIDDSITIRKITARTLERHNIDSVLAKDGVEALGMLEQETPDIIILDIEMPRMDGFEVAAHIRKQRLLQHVPILMVTSRSGAKHRERAAKLGVDDYLIKPYQEEELMAALYRLLERRQPASTALNINARAARSSALSH